MKTLNKIRRAVLFFRKPYPMGFYIRLCGGPENCPGPLIGPVEGIYTSIRNSEVYLRVDGHLKILIVTTKGDIWYDKNYYSGWKVISAVDFESF